MGCADIFNSGPHRFAPAQASETLFSFQEHCEVLSGNQLDTGRAGIRVRARRFNRNQYDSPDDPRDYMHRARGRTAHADKVGRSLMFLLPTSWQKRLRMCSHSLRSYYKRTTS